MRIRNTVFELNIPPVALVGVTSSTPPLPDLVPCGVTSIPIASSLILDEMEKVGDNEAGIFLPDEALKCYRYADVVQYLKLVRIDKIVYVKESMDCDDFARKLFGKFAGLVWTGAHALNWFIDETGKLWYIEPQTSQISDVLEGIAGNDFRVFMGA